MSSAKPATTPTARAVIPTRAVIPAQAGIQSLRGKACVACWGEVGVSQAVLRDLPTHWIPACAGMTFWLIPQPNSN